VIKSYYTDQDASGRVTVSKEVQENGLHYIEQPMSAEQAKNAKVPLAPDLYEHARQQMLDGKITKEQFEQFKLKPRDGDGGADNPYTGTGMSASNALVDANGKPFKAAINQEMNAGVQGLQEGAQLKMRGEGPGGDRAIATYEKQPVLDEHGKPSLGPDGQPLTEMRWNLDSNLSKEQREYYEQLIAKTQADVQNLKNAGSSP
jgi:hypothetical protein